MIYALLYFRRGIPPRDITVRGGDEGGLGQNFEGRAQIEGEFNAERRLIGRSRASRCAFIAASASWYLTV